MAVKDCNKCGKSWPLSDYYKCAIVKSGISGTCKTCAKKDASEWYRANAAKVLAQKAAERQADPLKFRRQSRRQYWANPEKYRALAREFSLANKERYSAMAKAKYAANRDAVRASVQEWRRRNPQKVRDYSGQYKEKNLPRLVAINAARRARQALATPAWGAQESMLLLYQKAAEWGMTVDHIVPISSKLVCGLHVHANLQLIRMEHNSSKGNRHWPDMPE